MNRRLAMSLLMSVGLLMGGCAQAPSDEAGGSTEAGAADKTTPPVAPPAPEESVVEPEPEGPSEAELLGLIPGDEVTQDPDLQKLLEKWKRQPISKSDKKKVSKSKSKWKGDLERAILHEEANVRSNAAGALTSLGKSSQTTKLLLERLEKEPDGDVRGHIAKQFVKYKDKSALPKLIEVMRKDENASARANAAWALSKHGDKSAAQPFLEALEDPESWVRLYAVNGVKRLRVKRAIPTLRLLLSDKSDLVARKAKEAIKSLGGR